MRKKYSGHFESPVDKDGPPVTAPPEVTAAELPPAVETKPPEPIATQSPADAASSSAIKDRLEEMVRAEGLQHQRQQQPPPQPQQQEVPAAVAKFLAENPRFMDPNDAVSQAEIYTATLKANRDGLKWDDDNFVPAIERHLGLRPAATNGTPVRAARPESTDVYERPSRPAAQPPRMSVPVSAPPTRQAPSMSTGRAPNYRAPLTRDELEIAAASGQTPEQYQQQKERMLRMKAAGEMQ